MEYLCTFFCNIRSSTAQSAIHLHCFEMNSQDILQNISLFSTEYFFFIWGRVNDCPFELPTWRFLLVGKDACWRLTLPRIPLPSRSLSLPLCTPWSPSVGVQSLLVMRWSAGWFCPGSWSLCSWCCEPDWHTSVCSGSPWSHGQRGSRRQSSRSD